MHIFFSFSQKHNEKLFQYFDIWNFSKLHLEGIHFVFRQTRYLGPGLGCKTEMLKGQRTKQLWSQACRKETTNGARQPLSCSRTGMAIINYVPESRGSLPGSKALTMLFRVHKIVQLCAGGGNTFIWGQCGVPLAWICDKDIRLFLETRVTTIWKAAGAKTCRAVKGKSHENVLVVSNWVSNSGAVQSFPTWGWKSVGGEVLAAGMKRFTCLSLTNKKGHLHYHFYFSMNISVVRTQICRSLNCCIIKSEVSDRDVCVEHLLSFLQKPHVFFQETILT